MNPKASEQWAQIILDAKAQTAALNSGKRDQQIYEDVISRVQLDARTSALREAAEVVHQYACKMRGAHVNTNDSCACIRKAILSLIDRKEGV